MADQYRVGRRCPWNIYRINPANESRDHDDRFAVAIGPDAPDDGPLIAAALNAYASTRVARVWQEGDLEPLVGTAIVDDEGDRWIKEDQGWVCLSDPSLDAEAWENLIREWGPLTEVIEGGDSNG